MKSRAANHLQDEMDKLINRFRFEYDMSYAEIVGCLELIKSGLTFEAIHEDMDHPDDLDELDDEDDSREEWENF